MAGVLQDFRYALKDGARFSLSGITLGLAGPRAQAVVGEPALRSWSGGWRDLLGGSHCDGGGHADGVLHPRTPRDAGRPHGGLEIRVRR